MTEQAIPQSVPKNERETIFRFSADEEQMQIGTASGTVARKMYRAGFSPLRIDRTRDGKVRWVSFEIPVSRFGWRIRRVEKRQRVKKEINERDTI